MLRVFRESSRRKMRKNKLSLLTAVVSAAVLALCSCGSEKKKSSETAPVKKAAASMTSDEMLKADFSGVTEASSGPVLSISNTTCKAGETTEVTLSVSGTEEKWNSCGLHITYPKELKCVHKSSDTDDIRFTLGDASEGSGASIGLECAADLSDELTSNGLSSIFFTTIFTEHGFDGDIMTFYLDIPADAQSGTVYPIGLFYYTNDNFKSIDSDDSYQLYAFSNFKGGTVTVE